MDFFEAGCCKRHGPPLWIYYGNLTQDLNKNILSIEYNALNLPCEVTFGNGNTVSYLYSAGGTKLRTVHKTGNTTATTDYVGNVVYENNSPKLLLTEAGYVSLSDGKYHYYLKDHQGNNRVVIASNGTVEEVNHYYPFGGVFASSGNVQPYKYNGKELDRKNGLDWYDYGARHYDAALGRFLTRDPMANKYWQWSSYAYCLDNPVRYVDPDGEFPIISNLIGAGLGVLTEYGGQVIGNIIENEEFSVSAFTDVDVADLLVAAGEGFITSGGSVIKNVAGKALIGLGAEVVQNTFDAKVSLEDASIETSVSSGAEVVGNTVVGLAAGQVKIGRYDVHVMQPKSNNQAVREARERLHAQGKSLPGSEADRLRQENKSRNGMVREVNRTVSDELSEAPGKWLSSVIKGIIKMINDDEKKK